MVFQHPYLFDGSVRDNVLVGDPTADPEMLSTATALARVDELTQRLPDADQDHGRRSRPGLRYPVVSANGSALPAHC